jgi:hypothetical protein
MQLNSKNAAEKKDNGTSDQYLSNLDLFNGT